MKTAIGMLVLMSGMAFAVPVPSPKLSNELAILEQKLLGEWVGQGGCIGDYSFHSNGTFEHKNYGPIGATLTGTWKVRWDALPPTLIVQYKESTIPDFIGQTAEFKLIKLDDEALDYRSSKSKEVTRFLRKKD